MKCMLVGIGVLFLVFASVSAEEERSLNVSYQGKNGWSAPVVRKVILLGDKELKERLDDDLALRKDLALEGDAGIRAEVIREGGPYGIISFGKENTVLVKFAVPPRIVVAAIGGFNIVDVICLFMPTDSAKGTQVYVEGERQWELVKGKRQWKIEAPWAEEVDKRMASRLRIAERACIKSDDRVGAAYIKLLLGDKKGAVRHLNLAAKRTLPRGEEPFKAVQVLSLLGELDIRNSLEEDAAKRRAGER